MKLLTLLPAVFGPAIPGIGISEHAFAQCETELQKIELDVPQSGARYGRSVALVGQTLYVGSPHAEGTGRVYIYDLTAGGFVLRDTLEPDGFGREFGWSIDVDHFRMVVGAPASFSYYGAAYIFELDGAAWRRTRRFPGNFVSIESKFGTSVALDGNRIAVGAFSENFVGRVRTFVRQPNGWVLEQTISPEVFGGTFGGGVDLEGSTLVVHDFGFPGDVHDVFHLQNVGGTWTFGSGVSVTGYNDFALQNDRLVVGDDSGVRLFERSGMAWTQVAAIDSPDRLPDDEFGRAVAIEGNRIVVGAPKTQSGRGAVYVFEGSGSAWDQVGRFTASDAQSFDRLGNSVAVCGWQVVAGAERDGADAGSSYFFEAVQPGGTGFCASGNSSLGEPAILSSAGCRTVSGEGVRFVVEPVPEPRAMFAYGPRTTYRPFGNSFLCVDGDLWTVQGQAEGPGRVSWLLEPGLPQHAQIVAGSKWFFQAWFRDPSAGTPGFNLSNALEISFLP